MEFSTKASLTKDILLQIKRLHLTKQEGFKSNKIFNPEFELSYGDNGVIVYFNNEVLFCIYGYDDHLQCDHKVHENKDHEWFYVEHYKDATNNKQLNYRSTLIDLPDDVDESTLFQLNTIYDNLAVQIIELEYLLRPYEAGEFLYFSINQKQYTDVNEKQLDELYHFLKVTL